MMPSRLSRMAQNSPAQASYSKENSRPSVRKCELQLNNHFLHNVGSPHTNTERPLPASVCSPGCHTSSVIPMNGSPIERKSHIIFWPQKILYAFLLITAGSRGFLNPGLRHDKKPERRGSGYRDAMQSITAASIRYALRRYQQQRFHGAVSGKKDAGIAPRRGIDFPVTVFNYTAAASYRVPKLVQRGMTAKRIAIARHERLNSTYGA